MAIEGRWLVNTGAASECCPYEIAVGCGELQLILRCPNWNLKTALVFTNQSPSGMVRGFGGQELGCAILPIISLAMEKAGVDPVEFFKKNIVKKGGGYFWREGNWWTFRGVDFCRAIDEGAEVFGWKDKWKGWGKPAAVNGVKRRGVGVGVHSNADVGEDASEAKVTLSSDGRVMLNVCVSESGHGQRSSLCKVAAEVLKVPLENVKMSAPDTEVNPFEFGLMGSRGTYAIGSAVLAAAEDARRRLLELAATKLGTMPDHLDTEDGMVYNIGRPENRVPWRRIMGLNRTIAGEGRFEPDYSLCNFLMTFVEVEVDTETGKVDIINVVNTTDAGKIISPMSLQGQLHGALGSAGLDTAILEETVRDVKTGRMLNGNMVDYKWRTFAGLPAFTNVILETLAPSHRFRALGVAEISTSSAPPAVHMAVCNAIGQKIMDYPLTPDKILKALA
jgi:xanthine dehydrogenase molybdenum-binding subunit